MFYKLLESASNGMHNDQTSNPEDRCWVEEYGKDSFRSEVQLILSKPQQLHSNGWEMLSLEEALNSLERLPQPPSVQNLTCILLKCRKKRNLVYAQRLYAYLCKSGLEAHTLLGNYLLPVLVEVGRLCDAQQVFNKLVDRNEFSWTSLITGYIQCGNSQHAFSLYHKMQEDCVNPSEYTFVPLLKACARLKDVERGQEMHAEIARKGLDSGLFIGNTLVDMYAKCGFLAKAREQFHKLQVRDVVSWTTLIAAYVEHGLGDEALDCFKQMRLEGVSPNAVTYVCSLKACGSIAALKNGQELHAEIASKGLLGRGTFVGSTLVDMYAKCDSLAKAREVFDELPVRSEVAWNALIMGYAKHGCGDEALNCLEQMHLEGVCPNIVTVICSLKACGSTGAITKGREMHGEIAKEGLESDLVVGGSLVDMYVKCGLLFEARQTFDKLLFRNVVSWNALIAGYAKHGLAEEALNCFEQMQLEGVSHNAVTFVCCLKACGSIAAIDKAREIHAEISRKGLEREPFVGNSLVDTYAKCGSLATAQEVFDKLLFRDIVSWNALIAGYANHGLAEESLNYFERMQEEGLSPDVVTFACSLKACGNIGAIDKGQDIHAEIVRRGLETDLVIGNTLVDMYAKCGLFAKAWETFDELPVQDVVAWTALISGYSDHGLGEQALNCFEQMQLEGVSPDALTYTCSLKACGCIGAIDKGQEMHAEMASKGLLDRDVSVGNAVVDMYTKCGWLAKGWEVFDKLPVRDVVSWNALITGYAHLGESENVFHMLNRMREGSIKPDGVTFLGVLTVCSHTGLVEKGQWFFEAMSRVYGITPTLEHHTCIVDLLGRAGQFDEAVAMMKNMPHHHDLVVWRAVLGACRKWGNAELGRQAFEHAVHLDETDAAAYVLMSNIFAETHLEED